jgi:hypothetical protein
MKTKLPTIASLLSHSPCSEGRAWLIAQPSLHAAWRTCPRSDWLLWALESTDLLRGREARLFACVCAEHVLPHFERLFPDDKRPRQAIAAARQYAAKPSAAMAAAMAAARAAAWAAARAAAMAAARAADSAAAWAAERKWQASKLRAIHPLKFQS